MVHHCRLIIVGGGKELVGTVKGLLILYIYLCKTLAKLETQHIRGK